MRWAAVIPMVLAFALLAPLPALAAPPPYYPPNDYGPPVGYWAYIVDPDGHNLEISYGQEVGLAVDAAR